MLNFGSFSGRISDRRLAFFIGTDYFHDSIVERIEFGPRIVALSIWCEREAAGEHSALGAKLLGVPKCSTGGRWPGRAGPDHDNYLYELRLERVVHCECTLDAREFNEYLNGRFIDSARVERLQEHSRNRLLHVRMQLTSGFLDIIFSKSTFRRMKGRVRIPVSRSRAMKVRATRSEILKDLRSSNEWTREAAMRQLILRKDKALRDIAQGILRARRTDDNDYLMSPDRVAAIYALGRSGTHEDISLLTHELSRSDRTLWRRHVADAIDWIDWRFKER